MPYSDLIRTLRFTTLDEGWRTEPDENGAYHLSFRFLTDDTVSTIDFNNGTNSALNYYSTNASWTSEFGGLFVPAGAQDAFETILKLSNLTEFSVFFGDVAPVSFTYSADNDPTDIAIGTLNNSTLSPSFASDTESFAKYLPGGSSGVSAATYGDIWLNMGKVGDAGTAVSWNWGEATISDNLFACVLHELAHSMGLKHADGPGGAGFTGREATEQYTIMPAVVNFSTLADIHQDMKGTDVENSVRPLGLQLYDIAAIQEIYGRNYERRGDDTSYKSGTGEAFGAYTSPFIYTIWDGGGIDVIDAHEYTVGAEIDLRQGHFSSIGVDAGGSSAVADDGGTGAPDVHGNVAIALYTVIENAIGTEASDNLIGNAWGNNLYGGGAADTIYGDGRSYDGKGTFNGNVDALRGEEVDWEDSAADDSGNDALLGGGGNDVIFGGKGDDLIHGGFDWAEITDAWTLWDEALQFYDIDAIAHEEDGIDTAIYSRLHLDANGDPNISPTTFGIQVTRDGENFIVQKGATGEFGTDLLISIETIVGTGGKDDFTSLVQKNFGDRPVTLSGGVGVDLYHYTLSDPLLNAAKDTGWVTILDTDGGIIDITDQAFHNVTVGLGEFDSSLVQLVTATTTGGLTITLDRVSLENGTGITDIALDGLRFNAAALVDWLMDQLPDNFLYALQDIGEDIGAVQDGTPSAETLVAVGSWATLAGGLGGDLYSLGTYASMVIEEPDEGTDTVESAVTYALPDNVENLTLTGSGSVHATGNTLENVLLGNTGANTLDGGAGADSMAGGSNSDTYFVDNIGDVITETVSAGLDKVLSSVSYTLAAHVDNLTLTGSAGIDATGNSDVNVLAGNDGNNTLNGSGGADTMAAGGGDDLYIVDNANDVVTENAAAGTDTVQTALTYVLGSNLENLALTASANVNGTGNASVNVITGNSVNNTLDGGAAADTLIGGAGNDTYKVDNASDVVTENASEGTDEIQSSVSYTLVANVENLTLTSTSSTTGTGNSLDNILTATDVLAVHTMIGGAGNDIYHLGLNNVVIENAAEGTDTVYALFSYTLTANVENLVAAGAYAVGNGLDNVITGGASTMDGAGGNDYITGSSGLTLIGGTGDDTFTLDYAGGSNSVIVENASEGTDLVLSSRTYTLAANIENLTVIGAGAVTVTGNSGNNILTGNGVGSTLAGGTGTGNDTFYVGAGDVVSEGASGGTDTVYSALSTYTLTTNVENLILTGTGNISGTGNTLGNTITGTSGNNTLDGGTGTDTLVGGTGDDTYLINVTADVVTENSGEGTDTVIASVTGYTLGTNLENLTLGGSVATGTGNSVANTLTGNSAANTLNGGDGADVLDGSTGNDAMNGGLDNDVFYVDSSSDNANENASEGTDTVYASVTYAMNTGSRVNVENLILTGANINGTGNSLVNTITGSSGNNTLDGSTGADSLIGGAGDDTYILDDAGDAVTENASEGTDTVQSGLTYTLGTNLENLTLSGSSGIHGTGNSGNNTITGNTGANSLSGADGADVLNGGSAVDTLNGGNGNDTLDGGAGNDLMDGGDGDDVYIVDSASDSLADSSGTDAVQSSVTYTLAAGLENLTLTGTTISGTGNTADNYLTGSASVNTLTGLDGNDTIDGGAGADTMVGGTGDDLYYISVTTDKVTEFASEGTDTVTATVTGYTLAANVENLILSGSVANATGNGENNSITGNSANNSVSGLLGDDTYMLGSGGNDTINETINGGGSDTLWITGGTTINDVTASTSGNNDIITYNGGGDQVTLTNVNTASSQYYIETIKFDDGFFTTLMDNNTWTSGTSGADTLTGNSSHNVIIGKDGADTLDGAGGDDDIHGGTGNDVVKGGSGTDLLHGGTGNDSIYGQDGLDTMFGGTGLDTFVFEAATAYNQVDVIKDFNVVTDDDALDFRDLLTGYNPGSHVLTDFVKIEDSGADSIASIDRDGTGGTYDWVQVATLKGITGLTDEVGLVNGGNLLAA